jgi:hexosaminidase
MPPFPAVEVTDSPRFTWRGLMIDAARHFQPVDVIKRNLNAILDENECLPLAFS